MGTTADNGCRKGVPLQDTLPVNVHQFTNSIKPLAGDRGGHENRRNYDDRSCRIDLINGRCATKMVGMGFDAVRSLVPVAGGQFQEAAASQSIMSSMPPPDAPLRWGTTSMYGCRPHCARSPNVRCWRISL